LESGLPNHPPAVKAFSFVPVLSVFSISSYAAGIMSNLVLFIIEQNWLVRLSSCDPFECTLVE
jgi:hypothetical protein